MHTESLQISFNPVIYLERMADFDPSKITLANIYTDLYQLNKTTNVYGNGKMQAMVFPSANYNGDNSSSEIIEKVKKYMAENTKIYVETTTRGTLEQIHWSKSTVSNEFIHDIYSGGTATTATSTAKDTSSGYDIRVPIFFVVPVGTVGEYHWIAELDGQRTILASPVKVICHQLSLTTDNFLVTEVAKNGLATLRALRYIRIGSSASSLKLIKCLNYKGLKFTILGSHMYPHPPTTIVSMSQSQKQVGCFVVHKESTATIAMGVGVPYARESVLPLLYKSIDCKVDSKELKFMTSITAGTPCKDSLKISTADIDNAWGLGIAMIHLDKTFIKDTNQEKFELSLQGFHLEDNCGNVVKVDFDWHEKQPWAIKDCNVIFDKN